MAEWLRSVYVHDLNILLANSRESTEFRVAALMPNSQAEHVDMAEAWRKIEVAEADFERERAAYLMAVDAIMGRRPGVLRRVLNRAKRSERSEPEEGEPSTDVPDPGDG
ncbi:MAG TPA: hypothetical protein VI028_08945 [Solirubrobacterales bacterium]